MPGQLDRARLAIPPGEEGRCDEFYVTLLGFYALEKPPLLGDRGGRWYQRGDVTLHLGVEEDFRLARKAHPALAIDEYEELLLRLRGAGVDVRGDESLPGTTRCHVSDPVGNRLELIDAATRR